METMQPNLLREAIMRALTNSVKLFTKDSAILPRFFIVFMVATF